MFPNWATSSGRSSVGVNGRAALMLVVTVPDVNVVIGTAGDAVAFW